MRETYSLILNSQNATNLTNINGQTQIQYYVNWNTVLPYKNSTTPNYFLLTWNLKSVNTAGILNQNAFVSINFGENNTCEQDGTSSKIGFIYPNQVQESGATWIYYYQAGLYDNPATTIAYPKNNLITVNFTDFNSATAFNMIHYVLTLNFEPIDE